MKKLLLALAFGAGLAYFLDPDRGTRRRHVGMDRARAISRRFFRASVRKAEYASEKAYGLARETLPHRSDNPNPDDATLKDRVESEILRDPTFRRAPINFNVENGVVVIRGEMTSQDDIDRLVSRARAISNVTGVESYLHLPGTPAPNKEQAIRVS